MRRLGLLAIIVWTGLVAPAAAQGVVQNLCGGGNGAQPVCIGTGNAAQPIELWPALNPTWRFQGVTFIPIADDTATMGDLTHRIKNPYFSGTTNVADLTATGTITGAVAATTVTFANGTQIKSSANGVIELENAAGTAFSRLNFGGTTASFPAIKRNTTALNFRLADDSADAPITAGAATLSGTLALSTNDLTMTGSLGSTGSRLTKGWFTDLQVTNAIAGSVTGNAATVTTNANLTGPITSTGNATAIASQTGTGTKFVVDTGPTLVTPVLGVATGTSLAATTTVTAGPTAGTELITNGSCATDTTGWAGANWSSSGGKCLHTAGSTATFVQAAAVPTLGRVYKLSVTISGRTAGSVQINLGATIQGTNYNTNGTFTRYIVALNSTALTITPLSSFDGSLASISAVPFTGNLGAAGPLYIGPSGFTADADLVLSVNDTGLPVGPSHTETHWVGGNNDQFNELYDTFNGFTRIRFRRANGTAGTPTAGASADVAGLIGAQSFGSTVYNSLENTDRAEIRWVAAEAQTDTAQGFRLEFRTTPTTGTATAEAGRFHASGGFSVGTTTDPGIGVISANVGFSAAGSAGTTHSACVTAVTAITVVGGLVTAITCTAPEASPEVLAARIQTLEADVAALRADLAAALAALKRQ